MFQSETYEILDCIVIEDELTESKTFNKSLNDDDFYLEFTVHPTTSDSSIARIRIEESSTKFIHIGDLFTNANCGVQWSNNGTASSFYGKGIDVDTDTKVTFTRRGTNVTLTVGESTYNITDMSILCNTLSFCTITNNTIKDMKIYPI